jgi:ankyrin repeat protein
MTDSGDGGTKGRLGLVAEDGSVVTSDEEVQKFLRKQVIAACKEGKASVLSDLAEVGVELQFATKSGRTGLHYAAREGHTKVCRLLLDKGFDANARNKWQETPLHAAAYNGRPDVASLLLEAGADVLAQNDQGKTPLDYARMASARGKFKKSCAQTIEVLSAATKTKANK